MKNVDLDIDEDVLTITIDLKRRFGFSKSGKTKIVASTSGPQAITRYKGISVNLTVFETLSKAEQQPGMEVLKELLAEHQNNQIKPKRKKKDERKDRA